LHCKRVMWGALVAGSPVGVNRFHFFRVFRLNCSGSRAGDE
jgi:hypothetical protein